MRSPLELFHTGLENLKVFKNIVDTAEDISRAGLANVPQWKGGVLHRDHNHCVQCAVLPHSPQSVCQISRDVQVMVRNGVSMDKSCKEVRE